MGTTYHGKVSGIVLTSDFVAKNPVTIATAGTITSGAGYNGDAVYGANYAWTIDNLGTIDATGAASYGIALKSGGEVVNGATDATTALIESGYGGVYIGGGAGTVVNFGTIHTIHSALPSVFLKEGGSVTNGQSGVIDFIRSAGASAIANAGSIYATSGYSSAIDLIDGGAITNQADGFIGARRVKFTSPAAITSENASATVTNFGTISDIDTIPLAIFLHAGGSVWNSGQITGGVDISGGPGEVDNTGTLSGGLLNLSVQLNAGGTVRNSGLVDHGVSVSGGAGEVENTGTIEIPSGNGVQLAAGGAVANSGLIAGEVSISGGAGNILNTGTIRPFGVYLGGGGSVTNSGLITSYFTGVSLTGSGNVTNYGSITGSTGVQLTQSGGAVDTLTNTGVVVGLGGTAVALDGGGAVANAGLIAGEVFVSGGAGDIVNTGTIRPFGVYLGGGGSITNWGLISAYYAAITIVGSGNVTNYGSITGSTGIDLSRSGGAADTLTNAGMIAGIGGTAVASGSGNDLLRIEPGAAFAGIVDGGGGSNTADLPATGGTGTMTGIGAVFENFTIDVDAGASWVWAGSNTLGPGTVLDVAGALTVYGSLTNAATIDVTGALADQGSLLNDGTIVDAGYLLLGPVHSDPGNHGWTEVGGGNTVEFAGPVARAQRLVFTDAAGTARLDHPRSFHALVEGFTEGDVIDLIGRSADSLSYADHQLVLTEGGHLVADLHFAGHYTASQFALYPDASGGTYLTLTGAMAAADFWKLKS